MNEFQDTPFILMPPNTTVGKVSRQLFSQCGFTPVVTFCSGNVIMIKEWGRTGSGVGLIPANYATTSKEVVYFRLDTPGYMTSCTVWRSGRSLSKEERYLIYLKFQLWDKQHLTLLTEFLWPNELCQILQEFDQNPGILPQNG